MADPPQYAGNTLKKFRNALLGETHHKTPVSHMRTIPGVVASYWTSEDWKTAWGLGFGLLLVNGVFSWTSVHMAKAGARVLDGMLSLSPSYASNGPDTSLLMAFGVLMGIAMGRFMVEVCGHMMSTTLNRTACKHLNDKFNEAVLSNRAYVHLLHSNAKDLPDNIDQRIEEAPSQVMSGALGLGIGISRAAFSLYFIGRELITTSTPVDALPMLGTYGTAALAFGAAAAFVPLSTYIAYQLGRVIERLTTLRQLASSTYRGELNDFTRRHLPIAAAMGEMVQKKIFGTLYDNVNSVWHKQNIASCYYMLFERAHNFMETKIVSYLPAMPALSAGKITTEKFLETSELVGKLINDCSWLITVMPTIARVKSYTHRLTELAEYIEAAQDAQEFYKKRGIAEINIIPHESPDDRDIYIKNIEIMVRGQDGVLLSGEGLRFKPGEWTAIQGPNGCGKSLLMKVINKLHPLGRGEIHMPQNATKSYIFQENYLERTTLKQIVCAPADESAFTDYEVQKVLELAGLEKYINLINEETSGDKRWQGALSGGEKQKIKLAQILLHKPDIICADEATSAMDAHAKIQFHKLIREQCPHSIMLAVVHDDALLGMPEGHDKPFFQNYVWIEKGRMSLHDHPQPGRHTPPTAPARPDHPPSPQ